MPDQPSQDEQNKWHRWFAVECNNLCWDLTTKKRTAEEDAKMLDAAHAAAFHWGAVGGDLNVIRAKSLLALVHALLGRGPSALSYAKESHAYLLGHDAPDWEAAIAHAILAHAACAAGDSELHARAYSDAKAAMEAITDPDDQAIARETFDLVPVP